MNLEAKLAVALLVMAGMGPRRRQSRPAPFTEPPDKAAAPTPTRRNENRGMNDTEQQRADAAQASGHLFQMTLGALQRIERKVDELSTDVAKVEERQNASKESAEHRHRNEGMVAEHRRDIEDADEKHELLVVRLGEVEKLADIIDRRTSGAMTKASGVARRVGVVMGAGLLEGARMVLRKWG
jgi:hypothetical protein